MAAVNAARARRLSYTPEETKVLEALAQWRALFPDDLRRYGTEALLGQMLRSKEIENQPTTFGTVIILGNAGREYAGLAPEGRASPGAALDRAYVAHGIHAMQDAGHVLIERKGRKLFVMQDDDGRFNLVAAQARGHSPRAVRRMARRYRLELMKRRAKLIIITPELRRLTPVADNNHTLIGLVRLPSPECKPIRHPRAIRGEGHRKSGKRRVRPTPRSAGSVWPAPHPPTTNEQGAPEHHAEVCAEE